MSAFGKSGFQLGREHIRKMTEDRSRITFLKMLQRKATDYAADINLTDPEDDFVHRILAEHDQTVPDIHSGDRNICDSLRRKYEGRFA